MPKQTKDVNQAKAIERNTHPILKLDDLLHIDGGLITRTRAKKK